MKGRKKTGKKPRMGTCTHCGAIGEVTDDHVPPKGLFPKSIPKNLVTVPSCLKCNGGASKDDEYLRLMLTMRADTSERPEVQEVLQKVWDSLERPQARGLATAFAENFVRREIVTTGGVNLSVAPTYIVDRERLSRVINRAVRGLFFSNTARRLPQDYVVSCSDELRIAEMPAESMPFWRRILGATINQTPTIVCANVFQYWFHVLDDEPNVSSWLLLFYGRVPFFCLTMPLSSMERIEARLQMEAPERY